MRERMVNMAIDKIIGRILDVIIDTVHDYLDGLCNGFGE